MAMSAVICGADDFVAIPDYSHGFLAVWTSGRVGLVLGERRAVASGD